MRFARVVLFVTLGLGGLAGCHHDPHPAPGEVPPLPPASGTPVGYLLDSSTELKLREDQLTKLQAIDTSLAAKNADLDVQLRQIERPEEEEQLSPQEQKAGKKPGRHNHAPGAAVVSNDDANRLHQLHKTNDRDALKQAWVVLDPDQQTVAKKILEDRGVEVPGVSDKRHAGGDDDAGQPLPGMEP